MTFLIDMNLSPEWKATLRSAGHDAVHWSEVGTFDAPDAQIMRYAVEGGMIVFTHDLDFGMILAYSGATKPSVVQLREQDVDPSSIGEAVLSALAQCREPLERGALVTIDLRRAKARLLPIERRPD